MSRRSAGLVLLALLAAACGNDGGGGGEAYAPQIDPAAFSTTVDNPYFPLVPGTRWVYEGRTEDGLERVVVEVTSQTRRVMGVDTVVVRDTATVDGKVAEETLDWFAQDDAGNVWYFGEDTKEFEGGKASTEGSWEAGVDGAQPGMVMRARPRPGDRYRQEYYEGEAEDMGEVLSLTERVTVPAGSFDGVLKTRDFSPLEPGVVEHKFYAPGVGAVLTETVEGGSERLQLLEKTGP